MVFQNYIIHQLNKIIFLLFLLLLSCREKKRISNVIRAVNIILKRFLDQGKARESDSFNNETDFNFNSVGQGP